MARIILIGSWLTRKKAVIGSPSIRVLRKEFGWGFEESLSILLSSFNEKQIRNALKSTK